LPQGLPCHQRAASLDSSDHLCDANHESAVEQHSQIGRRRKGYLPLKVAEGDDVDAAESSGPGQHFADLGHQPLARIANLRPSREVHAHHHGAPSHHAPCRDGRVYAAGEQGDECSRRADRQSANALDAAAEDVRGTLGDSDSDDDVRVRQIDPGVGVSSKVRADAPVDIEAALDIVGVRSLRLDFERPEGTRLTQRAKRGDLHHLRVLRDAVAHRHGSDAGNLSDALSDLVGSCRIRDRDGQPGRGSLRRADREPGERRIQVGLETALELCTVASFETYLVIRDEADALAHGVCSRGYL